MITKCKGALLYKVGYDNIEKILLLVSGELVKDDTLQLIWLWTSLGKFSGCIPKY